MNYFDRDKLRAARRLLNEWDSFQIPIDRNVIATLSVSPANDSEMRVRHIETPLREPVHPEDLSIEALARLQRLQETVAAFNSGRYLDTGEFKRIGIDFEEERPEPVPVAPPSAPGAVVDDGDEDILL